MFGKILTLVHDTGEILKHLHGYIAIDINATLLKGKRKLPGRYIISNPLKDPGCKGPIRPRPAFRRSRLHLEKWAHTADEEQNQNA
jgi:hypothetical protein